MPEATAVPTPSVDDYTYQGAPLATWIAANVTGERVYLTVVI